MSIDNPDPVDVAVGRNIRILRNRAGLSMEKLGAAMGITFQQIQKYENGTNRISAPMMVRAAQALDVNIEAFFFNVPGARTAADAADLEELRRLRQEGIDMAAAIDVAMKALGAVS